MSTSKEEGTAILEIRFKESDPGGSFNELFEVTCSALGTFIGRYQSRTKWLRIGSVVTRLVAVTGGIIGLLLLNPLALKFFPERVATNLAEADSVLVAGIVAILVGGVLTVEFAFGFTRKYTNWNITQFEMLAEKAEFHGAFSELFLAKSLTDMTPELFEEARKLSLASVHAFTIKKVDETRIWAQNLQSVMKALRQSNQALQSGVQTAATVTRKKKQEEEAAAAKKYAEEKAEKLARAEPSGLNVKVRANEGRPKALQLVVSDASDTLQKESWSVDVVQGDVVSRFLPKGRYMATLHDSATSKQIGSVAVVLDEDREIGI